MCVPGCVLTWEKWVSGEAGSLSRYGGQVVGQACEVLLVNSGGFPLQVHLSPGNKAETTTTVPVMRVFQERHGVTDMVVVADAGMFSADNLNNLEDAGFRFIVGPRLAKAPYDPAEHFERKGDYSEDGQVLESSRTMGAGVVYLWTFKRQKKDDKAINLTTEQMCSLALINAYHDPWQVEALFRFTKNDLRARPVFHHHRDRIEAHPTIIFAALAVTRYITATTGASLRKLVRNDPRSDTISIDNHEITAGPVITPDAPREFLDRLTRSPRGTRPVEVGPTRWTGRGWTTGIARC